TTALVLFSLLGFVSAKAESRAAFSAIDSARGGPAASPSGQGRREAAAPGSAGRVPRAAASLASSARRLSGTPERRTGPSPSTRTAVLAKRPVPRIEQVTRLPG